MTDNEIIVNDVNVAGCCNYKEVDFKDMPLCMNYFNHLPIPPKETEWEYCEGNPNCLYKQLQREKQKNKSTEEICPHCDAVVELPQNKGIYECSECGKLIVCCSMCENMDCKNCKYSLLIKSVEELQYKEQECEKLDNECQEQFNTILKLEDDIKRLQADNRELKEALINYLAIQPTDVEKQLFLRDREYYRYKQALDKIREILANHNEYGYGFCDNRLQPILDTINEVLNG